MADLIIIGGGPAGLSAAVSAASDGLETVLLESTRAVGGQASTSSRIENYLGFGQGVSGARLADVSRRQALRFGAEINTDSVVIDLRAVDGVLRAMCSSGHIFHGSSALVACGVSYRRLQAPGADDYLGRGVFYGISPMDAASYKGKRVLVVGGANSAGQAAIHLANMGARVEILTRSPLDKSMSQYLIDRCLGHRRIFVREGARVAAVLPNDELSAVAGVTIADSSDIVTEDCAALLVFIGAEPHTDWAPTLDRDARGFILTGETFESSIPGVFVAGDVRAGSIKRVAAAAGEGAMAVAHIHKRLTEGS